MTYDSEVLADSPIVYLKLDETSGTTCADSSGNGNTFTYQAGVTLAKPGLCYDGGTAFSASGSADGATRSVPASLVSPSDFTVECWVDLTSTANQGLVYVGNPGSNGYGLIVNSGNWMGLAGGLALIDSGVAATTGVHHVVVTRQVANNWKIYLDGTLIYTHGSQAYNGATGTVQVGQSGIPSSTVLDNVAIYNSALSATRIAAHYTAGSTPPPSPLTITPTVDDATGTVSLLIEDGVPPYVVTAHPSGFPSYVIRSPYGSVTGAPDSRVAVDGDVPLNTPVYYTVTDDDSPAASATSDTVTVEATTALLSDALDPQTVLPVEVVTQVPNRFQARSVWWDVLGRSEPFPSIAPMRLRDGTLQLRTETRAERLALLGLLSTGRPLLLRGTTPDVVDDVVALVADASEDYVIPNVPTLARYWSLQYQAVSRDPLGVYVFTPGRTYTDLNAEQASYDDLNAAYATYDNMRAGL